MSVSLPQVPTIATSKKGPIQNTIAKNNKLFSPLPPLDTRIFLPKFYAKKMFFNAFLQLEISTEMLLFFNHGVCYGKSARKVMLEYLLTEVFQSTKCYDYAMVP